MSLESNNTVKVTGSENENLVQITNSGAISVNQNTTYTLIIRGATNSTSSQFSIVVKQGVTTNGDESNSVELNGFGDKNTLLPVSTIGDTSLTFTTNSASSGTLTLYLKPTSGFYSTSTTSDATIHSIKLYTGTVIREEGFTAPTLDKTAGTVNGMPLYIQPGITDGTSIRYYWFFTGFGGNGKGTWIMNGYDDGTSTTPQINKVGDYYGYYEDNTSYSTRAISDGEYGLPAYFHGVNDSSHTFKVLNGVVSGYSRITHGPVYPSLEWFIENTNPIVIEKTIYNTNSHYIDSHHDSFTTNNTTQLRIGASPYSGSSNGDTLRISKLVVNNVEVFGDMFLAYGVNGVQSTRTYENLQTLGLQNSNSYTVTVYPYSGSGYGTSIL